MRLVLASGSPRRRALLEQIGYPPDETLAPDIDETPLVRETPAAYVARMAAAKLDRALATLDAEGGYTLAADTVVACGRRILPKTEDAAAARRCLELLSGRRHRVRTAVAVAAPNGARRQKTAETLVRFKRLSAEDVEGYLASGEWRGKAGGYAIQGRADRFVIALNGGYSNVVGLPTRIAADLLDGLGYRPEAAP